MITESDGWRPGCGGEAPLQACGPTLTSTNTNRGTAWSTPDPRHLLRRPRTPRTRQRLHRHLRSTPRTPLVPRTRHRAVHVQHRTVARWRGNVPWKASMARSAAQGPARSARAAVGSSTVGTGRAQSHGRLRRGHHLGVRAAHGRDRVGGAVAGGGGPVRRHRRRAAVSCQVTGVPLVLLGVGSESGPSLRGEWRSGTVLQCLLLGAHRLRGGPSRGLLDIMCIIGGGLKMPERGWNACAAGDLRIRGDRTDRGPRPGRPHTTPPGPPTAPGRHGAPPKHRGHHGDCG